MIHEPFSYQDMSLGELKLAEKRFTKSCDPLIFTKHLDWRDENELRLTFFDDSDGPRFLNFGDSLTAIVVTHSIDNHQLDELTKIANDRRVQLHKIYWEGKGSGGSWVNHDFFQKKK